MAEKAKRNKFLTGEFDLTSTSDISKSFLNYDSTKQWALIQQKDKEITLKRDFKNLKINPQILHNTNKAPFFDIHDFTKGSIYKDFLIPTGSYSFEIIKDKVIVQNVIRNLHINEYITSLEEEVESSIKKLYKNPGRKVLAYSGGIDSIVITSILEKFNLLEKTDFVTLINESKKTDQNLIPIEEFYNVYKNKIKSHRYIKTGIDVCERYFQENTYFELKHYSTMTLVESFPDSDLILGANGNHFFLHDKIFLDHILSHDNTKKENTINNLIGTNECYISSIIDYKKPNDLKSVDLAHIHHKYRSSMDTKTTRIHEPFITDAVSILYRTLDLTTVDLKTIMCADVAKNIIKKNNEDLLRYVKKESILDFDDGHDLFLDKDKIGLEEYIRKLYNKIKNFEYKEIMLEYISNCKKMEKIDFSSAMRLKAYECFFNSIDRFGKK